MTEGSPTLRVRYTGSPLWTSVGVPYIQCVTRYGLAAEVGPWVSRAWIMQQVHGTVGQLSGGASRAQGQFFQPIDAILHNRGISRAWTTFVLDKSDGFTQAGVERLNDLIRTYVWAILGSQAQACTNISKAGTGFDAQKQFMANIEDAIASLLDFPGCIARYQKNLGYASTLSDFVFGIGCYLASSLELGATSPRRRWSSIRGTYRAIITMS